MRILVAEDDPVSRRALGARLTNLGYDVIVARDGDEAWEIVRAGDSPKLVILDWMMPGIDGIEVCRRLRARPDGEFFYVLMLTAKDRKSDRASCGRGSGPAGAYSSLKKSLSAPARRFGTRPRTIHSRGSGTALPSLTYWKGSSTVRQERAVCSRS